MQNGAIKVPPELLGDALNEQIEFSTNEPGGGFFADAMIKLGEQAIVLGVEGFDNAMKQIHPEMAGLGGLPPENFSEVGKAFLEKKIPRDVLEEKPGTCLLIMTGFICAANGISYQRLKMKGELEKTKKKENE